MNRRSLTLAAGFALLSRPEAFAQEQMHDYGGTFTLVDHRSKTVMDEDFHGKYLLVSFGYTRCPDLCPTLLTTMASVLNQLGPSGASLQPLFNC